MRRKIALSLVGLLVVVGVLWWLRPSALDRLDVIVAELRARGEPLTFEDLEPPPVPDKENGAAEIDAALAWLDEHLQPGWKNEIVGPWNPNVIDDYMQTSSAEELDALRAFLVEIAPFYERVDRAAARPVIRWPLPPRDPVSGLRDCPDVPRQQRLHQLLEVRARASDDGTERLEAIVTSFRLTHRWEPRDAMDWLVRWAGDWSALVWLRDGVETRVIDPIAARTLLDDLLLDEPIDAMPSTLRAERTRLIEVLPHVADGGYEAAVWAVWGRPSAWSRLETAVGSFAKGRPLPYAWAQAHAAVDEIELLTTALELAPSWDPAYDERMRAALVESTNWTWLSQWFRIARRTKAARDLARIALAACAMRAEQRVWPAALDDLAPLLGAPVGVNPYTNGPYAMDVTGDALRLNGRRPDDDLDRDPLACRDPLDWFILPDVVEPR